MKTKHWIAVLALSATGAAGLNAQTLTGREIAQRVKDRPDGDTRRSEIIMKLINKRGSLRERRLVSYSFDTGKGKKDRKTLMFFLYPGDVKGTGFLTWDYDEIGKEDDKWLYLPAMKKTRRISGTSAKKDYFMGSDFTYDDMGSRNVDEDTHKLLGEETVGGHKCWKLESVPKDSRDIFSRKVAWARQDCYIGCRVEYYDKMDKLHRLLLISDVRKVDGFWMAGKLEMENVQTGHKTLLEIKDPKYDIPMDEAKFSVTTLETGKF